MRSKTPRIDVIVPVYNCGDYLPRCVESLLAQDFDSYTVTLVDDGSTDGSGALCDGYATAHPGRVRVLHQKNAGPSAARNSAVERSEAEYICFVDADDTVSKNYLSALLGAAEEFGAPMAVACLCREHPLPDGRARQVMPETMPRTVLDRDTALAEACYDRHFGCLTCGRLIRRDIALACPFPPGRIFEDSFAIWRQFMACDRVAYAPEAVYRYLQREGSLQRRAFEPRHLDLLDAAEEMMDMFQAENVSPAVMAAGAYKVCRACYVTAFHAAELPLGQFRQVCRRIVPLLRRYHAAARLDGPMGLRCRLLLGSRTLFYLAVKLAGRPPRPTEEST